MIVSFDNEYLFFHIARTGGTTLSQQLIEKAGCLRVGSQHLGVNELEKNAIINDRVKLFRKFTIVRDPWDRVISRYYGSHHYSTKGRSLTEYIDNWLPTERFMRPCIEYIKRKDGSIAVDDIFEFDKRPFTEVSVAAIAGVNVSTLMSPVVNPRDFVEYWRPNDYRSVYKKEESDKIASMYAEDINFFGFKF